MAFQLPHLSPRLRSVLKWVGYVLLALASFVMALQLTFPYDRVKDRIEDALDQKYDVTIGGVERGWVPGRFFLKDITLKTRPAAADVLKAMEIADPKEREKAQALLVSTVFIERLEVDVAFLPLIRGVASVYIDATIGNPSQTGHIKGTIAIGKSGTGVHIEGNDLPADAMPMREIIGLPMSGTLEFSFDLDLPNDQLKSGKTGPNWQAAEGGMEFNCPSGCVFGDGKTKLKPKLKNARNQAFAENGIEFGTIRIDSMSASVDIKDKKLNLKKFEARSSDGELHVDFNLELGQEFGESNTKGCLRFKGSEALNKREPKTFAAISTTGANVGPDGLFHIKLDGKFKEMKRLAQPCGPGVTDKNMDNPGGSGGSGIPQHRPNPNLPPPTPMDAAPGGTPTPTPGITNIIPPHDAAPSDAPVAVPPSVPDHEHDTGSGSGSGGSGSGTADGTAGAGAAPAGEPSRRN